ncbi:MAG: hypothetical protein AAGK02_06760 [Pseudomonadota bacterium]
MSLRAFLMLILLVPIVIVGGAMVGGITIPVPELGRNYVLKFSLGGDERSVGLPHIMGPDDPSRPLLVMIRATEVVIPVQ